MKIIAHRPFRDERAVRDFDLSCLDGFDGFELDLRGGPSGGVSVFHGPIFSVRGRPSGGAMKSLTAVIARLRGAPTALGMVLFDVKTGAAARRIGEALDLVDWDAEIGFICWRRDEVDLVREARPKARVFFAVAPLRDGRLTRLLPEDLTLFNGFPYVARSGRYRPKAAQFNRHNIHVWRGDPERLSALAPSGATGLCFHRRFLTPRLRRGAREAGLEVAVYGYGPDDIASLERGADEIDVAIVDPSLGAPLRGRTARNVDLIGKRLRRRLKRSRAV